MASGGPRRVRCSTIVRANAANTAWSIGRALGWQDIDVIDDDLGISASGTRRAGFDQLLRAVCVGQVGAVFSIDASRWPAMAGSGIRCWNSAV